MFQFRRFPAYAYLIQRTLTEYCSAGFPHSEIRGSKLMCSSPRLIAACHVLRRLLMPRHSPCALSSLTSGPRQELCRRHRSFEIVMLPWRPFGRLSTFRFQVRLPADPLLLARFFTRINVVQFSRCSSNLFQGQIETLRAGRMLRFVLVVEISGFEPLASCLQGRRSPS